MSRNDPPRHRSIHDPQHAEAERARDDRIRDPYEADRRVRTFGDERPQAAAHPWDAAHDGPGDDFDNAGRAFRNPRPSWSEQPARYGGGYHGDDPHASTARYAAGERDRARQDWNDERAGAYDEGQSNSGYDTRDADNERLRQRAGQRSDAGLRARGPHGDRGASGRGYLGAQDGRPDTYGSAGYQQQGKRYHFDEAGDERGRAQSFRGVRPRNYVRSDERLCELINEQLTDADIDASDIEVKVHAGTVILEGTVSERWMKHQAEDIVDECGVADIQNQLRVRRHTTPQQPAATAAGTDHADTPTTAQDSPAPDATAADNARLKH